MLKGPKMPPVAGPSHRFAQVPSATIERSVFDRSHAYKTTFSAGYLVPFLVDEALPGDTFAVKARLFARLATQLKPIMDNLYLETFFFFVPLRLVWSNFQKFMGEQINPGDSTAFVIPQQTVPAAGYAIGSLQDYFGLPTGIARTGSNWSHSCLPTRAYYRIYNEWFRDENIVQSVDGVGSFGSGFSISDGPDAAPVGGCAVLKRGKRHDYFTSCLPWPQKGTAVSIPLGNNAPVYAGAGTTAIGVGVTGATGTPNFLNNVGANNIQRSASVGGSPLYADLSGAVSPTINSLRQAFQIQKMYEKDARGGTRYTEIVRSHFGVVSPDSRLQRAEYLGGGSSPVSVVPVAQMTQSGLTGGATAQGNLSGVGVISAMDGHGFTKSFTEHGIILGLVNVRADITYQQGMDKMWSRSTRNDFYWPSFAHLGEQAVLNQEIYTADNASQNVAAFGYQERYAEYRYKPSKITGLFRSYAAGTLEIWHLSEKFTALPTLNQTFIEDQTSSILDRINAVATEPDLLLDSWIEMKCARPMPVYSVPGMIDHF